MIKINVPNIDGHIWNIEKITIDIIESISHNDHVIITVDGEGPDLTELGLYHLLDTICQKFDVDKRKIIIHTWNQLEHSNQYQIKKHPPMYIDTGQKFIKQFLPNDKTFNKLKHFGLFVSRSCWQRLYLASHLYNNYQDKTLLTFHYDSQSDYHKNHLGFENLSHIIGHKQAITHTQHLLNNVPMIDATRDLSPVRSPEHYTITNLYPDFFVEIVCETFCEGTTFYPTEKTWRPIMCRTPFIVQGPRNHLQNLKKLGFKTFNQYWSEGYDEDSGIVSVQNVQVLIDQLSSLSLSELESMYNSMRPILDHNYEVFQNLSDEKFKQIWP